MKLVVFERRGAGEPGARGHAADAGRSIGAAALGFEALEGVTLGQRRIGVLLDDPADTVVDLNRALAVKLAAEDAGAPEAEADSLLPPRIGSYLRRLPDSRLAAQVALDFVTRSIGCYDAPDLAAAAALLPRRSVRLLAPVQQPGKLVAALEGRAGDPPQLFLVAPSAVSGPEDEVRLPEGVEVAVEPQIAAVIGRRTRCVTPQQALASIAGYCAALRFHTEGPAAPDGPIRYSGDGFAPLGPALVGAEDLPDPHDLRVELRVSKRRRDATHTKELPQPMHELVARVSAVMTLEPGDVLLSGAPRSVGGRSTGLRDGDVVELEIERLGRLAVHLRSARDG